MHNNNNLLIQ